MYACLLDGIYWTGNFRHLFLKDAERSRKIKEGRERKWDEGEQREEAMVLKNC